MAPFTLAFVVAIVTSYAIPWKILGAEGATAFARRGALSWTALSRGETWRIPATCFLHGDWDHVRSSAAFILIYGLLLEPVIGSRRVILATVATLLTSSVASVAFSAGGYGSSGVAYGFEGLLLARPFIRRPNGGRAFNWTWALLAWITLWYLPDQQDVAHIDVAGHMGGLVGGLWLGCMWFAGDVAPRGRRVLRYEVALATALAAVAVAAFAMNPRWRVDWNERLAYEAGERHDPKTAQRYWERVEALADPTFPCDAQALDGAARFWARRHEVAHACRIMEAISPTLGADEYDDLGSFQAYLEPADERGAIRSWNASLDLEPDNAAVLDRLANLRLFAEDTTLYAPDAAYFYAQCAVNQDRCRSPIYLRTLAFAEYLRGHDARSIEIMQQAIARGPSDVSSFESDLAEMRNGTFTTSDGDSTATTHDSGS